jgi:hypothetical protein
LARDIGGFGQEAARVSATWLAGDFIVLSRSIAMVRSHHRMIVIWLVSVLGVVLPIARGGPMAAAD